MKINVILFLYLLYNRKLNIVYVACILVQLNRYRCTIRLHILAPGTETRHRVGA